MHVDLTSFTDVAQHALYDDSLGAPNGPDDVHELLDRGVPEGRLLVIDTGADGEIHLSLYVDEPMPDELRSAVVWETLDVLLRVPTGKLAASGLEYVGNVEPSAQSKVDVPAGNYLIDFYERDVDWDREIAPVLARELGSAYRREEGFGPLGGFLVVSGFVTTVISAFAWSLIVLSIGVLLAALGIVTWRLGLPKGDYDRQKRAIEMRFPTYVLVLRRFPEDADLASYRGVVIGPD